MGLSKVFSAAYLTVSLVPREEPEDPWLWLGKKLACLWGGVLYGHPWSTFVEESFSVEVGMGGSTEDDPRICAWMHLYACMWVGRGEGKFPFPCRAGGICSISI